jgi:hypothetical protein
VEFLPRFLSAALVGILGIIGINLAVKLGSELLEILGIRNYFRDVGLSGSALNIISGLFKAFLYLILLQVALAQLGIGDTFINELVTASSWAAAFMVAALVFYGFKDLFQNVAAGIYLKNNRNVRRGERVFLEEHSGKIMDVSVFSTILETDEGYTMVVKNEKVMDADLKFKRTQGDIETLEDIKKYFVAQDPSYCGPACAEMALNVFGYRFSQEKIGEMSGTEVGEGTRPEPLMESIEELTEGEVQAEYVEQEKITNLADEAKTWLNDGALLMLNFAKPYLFPDANTAHYALCVGVEGDELLIVDPSTSTGSGGVYYIDASEMLQAMGEYQGRTRGYMVMAPEDTTAYWRLENDLIYSDENLYDQLNKNMEMQLRRILRQGRVMRNVLPDNLQSYLDRWEKGEKVGRLWKAGEEGDNETSDTDE